MDLILERERFVKSLKENKKDEIQNIKGKVKNFSKTPFGAILLFGFSQIFIKIFGFIKNRYLAGFFGTSLEKDIFDSAFLIPDAIYAISSESIMMFAFFPIFMRLKEENLKSALRFAGRVLIFLSFLVFFVSAIFFFSTESLAKFILDNNISESKKDLFVLWSKSLIPVGIFLSFSNFFSATLISEKRYIRFALAPLLYNFGTIFGVAVLSKFFGVNGIIFGTLIGAFLHMLTQINLKFDFKNIFSPLEKAEKDFLRISLPFFFSTIFIRKLTDFLISEKANSLGAGVFASFGYAFNIFAIANSLISITISQAFYVDFTKKDFLKSFQKALNLIIFFSIPASFLLFVFRAQLVRILYGADGFDWRSTILTLEHLQALSFGLIFFNLIPIISRIFYAKEETKFPIFANFISMIFLIFGFFLLGEKSNVTIFSSIISFSYFVSFMVLMIFFVKKFRNFEFKKIFIEILKILGSSILMAIIIYAGLNIWDKFFITNTFLTIFLQVTFSFSLGLVGFFSVLFSMNSENFKFLKTRVLEFFKR